MRHMTGTVIRGVHTIPMPIAIAELEFLFEPNSNRRKPGTNNKNDLMQIKYIADRN